MRWLPIALLLVFVLASGCVSTIIPNDKKVEFNVTEGQVYNQLTLESSNERNVFNPAEGYRFWVLNLSVSNLKEAYTNVTDIYLDTQAGRYTKEMIVNFTTYPKLSTYCTPLAIPTTLSSLETKKGCLIYQVLANDTNFDNGTVGVNLVTA